MSLNDTNVIHEPNLATVMMVEEAILNAEEYMTKTELRNSLPKKIMYQTFNRVLEYLEKSNKICYNESTILWIGSENEDFRKMLESCRKTK